VKLAVIGDPVSHSRSPEIHRRLLADEGIDGSYVAIRVPKENTINVLRRMRLDGYTGCNVTTPLKEEAMVACDVVDESVRTAEAVNTIFFGMKIYGTNTDGIGARSALESVLGESVSLHRIGILGTGAAARAILGALRETDVYAFCWGRDPQKVVELCERFECQIWPVGNPPEIVLSTLPPNSRPHEAIVADLRKADVVMDANYGERSTLERILEREVVRGDLMLEAQARASFDYWLAHLDRVSSDS